MKKAWLVTLAVIFAAQAGYVGNTIVQAERTLKTGTLYRFRTAPVDPYDAFRGRYVRLEFALENQHHPIKNTADCKDWHYGHRAWIQLTKDASHVARVISVVKTKPEADAIPVTTHYCKDEAHSASNLKKYLLSPPSSKDKAHPSINPPFNSQPTIKINLPFKRFYANELLAPELEKRARKSAKDSYLWVRVRGRYAIPEKLEISD